MADFDNVVPMYDGRRLVTMNSSAAAAANATALNSWLSDLGSTRKTQGLWFPVGDVWIDDTLVVPHSQGGLIQGSGSTMDSPVGEAHAAFNRNQCTRIIGDQLPVMFDYSGAGMTINDIVFQGRVADQIVDLDDLYSTFAEKGIQIREKTGAMSWGPGKLTMPNVGFIGVDDCIYCGEDGVESQADSVAIGVVRTIYTGSLLKISSPQAVGHIINHALMKGTHRVIDTDKGVYTGTDVTGGSIEMGLLQVDQTQNFGAPTIVKTGLMATAAPDIGIRRLYLDGALDSCVLWNSGVTSAANFDIGYLRIPTQILGTIKATVRGTNRFTVHNGYGFREGMIIFHEVSGEEPNALFLGGTMKTGASHLNLFDPATGTGDGWLTIQNVVSLLGAGGPCKWTKQKITDHAVASTETVNSTTV